MLNQTIVQTYKNYKDYEVNNQLTFLSWIDLIKNGNHDYINYIQSARQVGKGNNEYDSFKSQVPVCSLNFIFGVKRENKAVLRPTGLLYIDIDDSTFNINSIDKNLLHAYWKSFGGNGYSIVVRVNGLTIENFHSSYENIISLLGIKDVYDKGAKSATQANVLSYDPNLFYNNDSYIFSSVSDDGKKVSNGITKKIEGEVLPNRTFFTGDIRYDNIEDYFTGEYENQKYRVLEDNEQMIAKVIVPWFSDEGKRNRNLFSFGCQVVAINADRGINRQVLLKLLKYANNKIHKPLNEKEVTNICNSVWKRFNEGKISLYLNHKRRVLFNPKFKMSGKERIKLCNQLLGKRKSDNTRSKIYDTIESWNFSSEGKITQISVAKKLGVNKSTVKRYWKDFKQYARDLNIENEVIGSRTIENIQTEPVDKDYRLSEEVDIIEFLKELHIRFNIDTRFIVDFQHVINKSSTTVGEILKKLFQINKDKKYRYSEYEGINVPMGIIKNLKERKLKLVA